MDILVKGMDMPCMCCLCPCHDWDTETDRYYCQALKDEPRIIDENTRRDDCPLVEVSTPHGRLIDADALPLKDIDNSNYPSNYIKAAPTIIKAED
jgi:hypothetical protein